MTAETQIIDGNRFLALQRETEEAMASAESEALKILYGLIAWLEERIDSEELFHKVTAASGEINTRKMFDLKNDIAAFQESKSNWAKLLSPKSFHYRIPTGPIYLGVFRDESGKSRLQFYRTRNQKISVRKLDGISANSDVELAKHYLEAAKKVLASILEEWNLSDEVDEVTLFVHKFFGKDEKVPFVFMAVYLINPEEVVASVGTYKVIELGGEIKSGVVNYTVWKKQRDREKAKF